MAHRPCILVIDDDETISQLIDDVLSPSFAVVTASDVGRVFELLFSRRFDLLILDPFFPGSMGLDAALTIRAMSSLSNIPILALSDSNELTQRLIGQVQGVISKPFSISELAKSVTDILHTSVSHDECHPMAA